jgi:hypothetical protein
MPRWVIDLLACWQGRLGRHQHVEIWKAIPHCLMWCLWRERNVHTFEDCKQNVLALKLQFLQTLFDWMIATDLFSFSFFLDFIDSCSSVLIL